MKKKNDFIYYLSLVTQIGLTIIASILIGLYIGIFLDRTLKTKGVFLIIFLLIGIAGGFYNSYKQILRK
ncbi:MAG: AtpZ/AtpI family protein [Candidatus Omnitrophica bacterium]|nr:AtpZ/AtpI family protein [Candidatus Omnitrophota bacterium]